MDNKFYNMAILYDLN